MLIKKNLPWILVTILIIIVISVVIYFILKNKGKENYVKNYYSNEKIIEDKIVKNFLLETYSSEYTKIQQIIQKENIHNNPLSNEFNRIFHLSHIIKKEINVDRNKALENIKKEADNIGLNSKFCKRILKNIETAEKFSLDFFKEIEKEEKIGKIINNIAYELIEEVLEKEENSEKIENYQDDEKLHNCLKILYKKINNTNEKIHEFKKCLNDNKINNLQIIKNSEIIKNLAKKADIRDETLEKILKNENEIKNFIYGLKTLEDYDPEYYIENYSFWGSIGNFFKHIGEDIRHDVQVARKWFIHVGDVIKKDAEKVDKWIVHTADVIGDDIKIDTEKAVRWFVKAYHAIGKWISKEEIIIKNGILHEIQVVSNFVERAYNAIKNGVMKFVHIIEKIGEEAWEKIKHFIIHYIHKQFEDLMHLFSVKHLPGGKTVMTSFYKLIENYLQSILKAWVNDVLPFVGGLIIDELFPPLFHILMTVIADIINHFVHINHPRWSLVFCYSFTSCNGPGIKNINKIFENYTFIDNYDSDIIDFNKDWKNHVKKYILISQNIDFDTKEKEIEKKKIEKEESEKQKITEKNKNKENKEDIKNLILKYLLKEFNIKLPYENNKLEELVDNIMKKK